MKQDYTLDELQTEMTALAQLFDSVTLADPRMGLLDPATLQPLNKVAAMPALDAAGRGLKIEKAADGLRTVNVETVRYKAAPTPYGKPAQRPKGERKPPRKKT